MGDSRERREKGCQETDEKKASWEFLISGIELMKKQEYDDAISSFKIGLEMVQKSSHNILEMMAYQLLGNAHLKKKEYDDAIFYFKKCLAIAQESRDKETEMNAYMMLGKAHWEKEEYDDAIWYGEKCFHIAQKCDSKDGEMQAYLVLANAYLNKEEYDDAKSYGEKTLSIAQECGDKDAEIQAYLMLANAYLKKEEYDDAKSYGEKTLSIAQECGDKDAEIQAYLLLANAYLKKEEYDDAKSYGEKTLSIAQECGDKDAEIQAYLLLANAHLNKEEYDDAISYSEKCRSIAQECGDKKTEMKAYTFLRDAHLGKDDDDAIFYSKKCLAIAQESCSKEDEMDAYAKLGHALLKKEEYEDMISYGKKWLSLAQACGDTEAERTACTVLGSAHLHKEEYDDYISYSKKYLTIAQDSSDQKKFMAETYVSLGSVYWKKGEYQDGIAYSKKGLAMALECGDKASEIVAYKSLGRVHYERKEYDDAILYIKKFLAMAQQSGNKQDEMFPYIELGTVHMKKQEYDAAISYDEKCLHIAQECGDKDAEIQAYLMLANAYLDKEEYDDAKSYGEKALSIAQECGDKDAEMEVSLILANAYLNKQEYDDALSYSEKWLSLAQACGNTKAEMNAYITLGTVHIKKEQYDDAIFYSKKCLAIAQESGSKEDEMRAYVNLAHALLKKQEYEDMIKYGEKWLSLAKECGDKDDEMKAYFILANAYLNKQEYYDAISYSDKCLSLAKECGDKKTEMEAYLVLANTYLNKEECGKAIDCGKKCLVIAQKSDKKEKEMRAYRVLGDAHWKNNAYDDAHSCFKKGEKIAIDLQDDSSKSIFESCLIMTYEEVGIETSNKLDVDIFHAIQITGFNRDDDEIKWFSIYQQYVRHKHKDEYQQAIACLKEAEATLPTTQPRIGSIQCHKKRWLCKHGISEMYVKLGQHHEALKYQQEALDVAVTNSQKATSHLSLGKLYYKRQELENSKQSLEKSLKCNELIFKDLKKNDRFKIAFVDKYKEAYKMLLKILIETNKKEEALVLSDRYRAKALKDLLVSSYGMKEDPVAEDDLKYADVQSLVSSRNYSLLLYSSCDEELCTFLLQAGKELEFSDQHFEYCDKCLDKLVDKAFDDMQVRQVVNCEDRSLDVMEDFEENKNPKEDELTRMLTRQKEERLTEQCRSICGYRCLAEEDEIFRSEGPSGLQILYHKLIHNIKQLIKQDEIVIIPEGPLYKVPFAALWDPDKGQYLLETKRIRMVPSMATLKFLQESYPDEQYLRKEALVIGDPLVGEVMMAGKKEDIKPLAGALNEAKHVGDVLGVQPLLEANATKAAVIKRLREGAFIVHIAAHGHLEKSTILLAPTPESRENEKIPGEKDYMLTMADVQQTQVRAQLVVLSCCHSGRGKIKAEGVVGMCRAFLASGARAVMGSLWAVADEATRMFMETFYSHLKDGKSASTSLHLTMNDMRKTPEYSEPKYWAPFFLMGDDVTIKFED